MEICGLAVGYVAGKKTNVVLNDISLSLKQGELTCLLGANGVGKSTLLRTLTGAQSPLKGEIRVFGKPLRGYNQKQLSRLIGVVTTERTYAGGLTVTELVGLGSQPNMGGRHHLHRPR